MSSLIAETDPNARQPQGAPDVSSSGWDSQEWPGIHQDCFRHIICVDYACMPQPLCSFSSSRTILNEAVALASICWWGGQGPPLRGFQTDNIWPGSFLFLCSKKPLRESKALEINDFSCPAFITHPPIGFSALFQVFQSFLVKPVSPLESAARLCKTSKSPECLLFQWTAEDGEQESWGFQNLILKVQVQGGETSKVQAFVLHFPKLL